MKQIDPYQIITALLGISIIIAIGLFVFNLTRGSFGKAALNVDIVYDKGTVLIGGKDKGETPVYTEEIKSGDLEVTINGEKNSYSTIIKPAAGTLAVIQRDLGVSDKFSSGQNIWFTKIGGEETAVSVISPDVEEVSVIVDGVEIGKTPVRFLTKDLLKQNEEGRYTLAFKKSGYEEQEVEVKVKEGFELNIRTDMFLKPIPGSVSILDGFQEGVTFLNFSNITEPAFSDKQNWAKAINYWLNTRGAVVLENSKVESFGAFIASSGDIYNSEGNKISADDLKVESGLTIAYLDINQAEKPSAEALLAIADITDGVVPASASQVKIKATGLGFLRVRSGPGTGNAQVATVEVGKLYKLVSEKGGWYEIEYKEGETGWISGSYADKVE